MSKTTISNIQIKPHGSVPGEVKVTVSADVANRDGKTPEAVFPAQGGTPMTHKSGDTWSASDTQTYDGSEQTITIQCNGAHASKTFKP